MISLHQNDSETWVEIDGKVLDVQDASDTSVYAYCELDDLVGQLASGFPPSLTLEVHSTDGFGTFFFHEIRLAGHDGGVALTFDCHTPNKYWEGRFGLATLIGSIAEQAKYLQNWQITHTELDDDWKAISLQTLVENGRSIFDRITRAAEELSRLLRDAETALAGLAWKPDYDSDEALFSKEVLLPLLRRMGFQFVRYSHGTREYGKDFTFSEETLFGNLRHYAMQAKAGDIRGGVNSAIDELLGQIEDAFTMPYYELGSKDPQFISSFVIAISGSFTENAREKIVEKTRRTLVGSIYFLDRERIEELVERYWKL